MEMYEHLRVYRMTFSDGSFAEPVGFYRLGGEDSEEICLEDVLKIVMGDGDNDQDFNVVTHHQLTRFYTGIGAFAGSLLVGILANIAQKHIPDMPIWAHQWLGILVTISMIVMAAMLIVAAIRAHSVISIENHLLLEMAERLGRWRERLERDAQKEGKKTPQSPKGDAM